MSECHFNGISVQKRLFGDTESKKLKAVKCKIFGACGRCWSSLSMPYSHALCHHHKPGLAANWVWLLWLTDSIQFYLVQVAHLLLVLVGVTDVFIKITICPLICCYTNTVTDTTRAFGEHRTLPRHIWSTVLDLVRMTCDIRREVVPLNTL